jgi:sec-independent protein translocase protein TatA
MLRGLFEGPAPWIILAVVVLLFGATRLPALARSLGQSMSIFRKEIKDGKTDGEKSEAAGDDTPAAATTTSPTAGTVKSEAATSADGTAAK